jgi:hypothetical protein
VPRSRRVPARRPAVRWRGNRETRERHLKSFETTTQDAMTLSATGNGNDAMSMFKSNALQRSIGATVTSCVLASDSRPMRQLPTEGI